jgi:hypothetical protein
LPVGWFDSASRGGIPGHLVATVVLCGVSDLPALVAGLVVISSALWACWSNAWLLRVLLDLQAAHEDRAALTVAEERVPEPAVLPAVAVGPAVV